MSEPMSKAGQSSDLTLRADDLEDFCRGAAFLGTGGGGSPYLGRLLAQRIMAEGKTVDIISVDDVPDDALVIPTAGMGAPTIGIEKLQRGDETVIALRRLEAHLGRKAFATMPVEMGGANSVTPLIVGAQTGLPVINADGMGRAFPELQMVTFSIYGIQTSPFTMTDEHGECVLIEARDNKSAEGLARAVCIQMGGMAHMGLYPMSGAEVKKVAVRDTMTLGLEIGRTIRLAREASTDPFEALAAYLRTTEYYRHCDVIFDGKIVDVRRETARGFAIGHVIMEGVGGYRGKMEVTFQNENLVARLDGRTRAIVPDLVCICDSETAEPITTDGLRYGQRVRVMAVSAPPILRTPEALEIVGPQCFGLDEPFHPLEELG